MAQFPPSARATRPSVTSKVALVAWVRPPAAATSVYPRPGFARLIPPKLAIPSTALAVNDPLSVALPGLAPMDNVTALRAPATLVPVESWISTWITGEMVPSTVVLVGCTLKASFLGAWITANDAAPGIPRAAAVMVTEPGPTALASPVLSMVATAWLEDSQTKRAPATALLFASLAAAANCWVAPRAVTEAVPGVTLTVATSCATVTAA